MKMHQPQPTMNAVVLEDDVWGSVCDLLHAAPTSMPPADRFLAREDGSSSPEYMSASSTSHDPISPLQAPIEDDMWASVCTLLDGNPPSPSSLRRPPSVLESVAPKPKRMRVSKAKVQVEQLEEEINELQSQLIQARQMVALAAREPSKWERAATQQRIEKNRSLDENRTLHAAVRERGDFIGRLQKLVTRPHRWAALPDTPSTTAPLPGNPVDRAAAIHALIDPLFKQFQSILIQANAFDLVEDTHFSDPITLPNQEIGFQAVNHVNMPVPHQAIATALWRVFSGDEKATPGSVGPTEVNVWERFDADTVYERYTVRQNDKSCHCNMIRKRYDSDGRVVIVWRTVLDDTLVVRAPTDVVDDACGWTTFAANPDDPSKSRTTIVVRSNISRLVESYDDLEDPADVIAAMRRLVVGKTLPLPDQETLPPIVSAYVQRGRRLRPMMVRAIERTLQDYQALHRLDKL
ncbi:Aste57867_19615 [Aphanomyces stellatus]|uniref:Aste57867_19615 protein n=1 Tax=Aphanomyces stellatus TaxID=120398 RepID=A0A485LEU4_9STRA|nr:hypothetical protein As57867_019551 [Aphanomyces stellatus]VFT96315.1 Aste57867_19615 [Aphanomyces stellatus]